MQVNVEIKEAVTTLTALDLQLSTHHNALPLLTLELVEIVQCIGSLVCHAIKKPSYRSQLRRHGRKIKCMNSLHLFKATNAAYKQG